MTDIQAEEPIQAPMVDTAQTTLDTTSGDGSLSVFESTKEVWRLWKGSILIKILSGILVVILILMIIFIIIMSKSESNDAKCTYVICSQLRCKGMGKSALRSVHSTDQWPNHVARLCDHSSQASAFSYSHLSAVVKSFPTSISLCHAGQ